MEEEFYNDAPSDPVNSRGEESPEQFAADLPEPEEKSDLVSQVSDAGWAFRGIAPDESRHCLYKRRNFYSFINAADKTAIHSLLQEEAANLEMELQNQQVFIDKVIDQHAARFSAKIRYGDEMIALEQTKLQNIESLKIALLAEKVKLEEKSKQIVDKISNIAQEIAIEKKDILGKWILEARQKLEEVFTISKQITAEKQEVFDRFFSEGKDQHLDLEKQFISLREASLSQLEQVNDRLKQSAPEGITLLSAKRLYRLGLVAAVAAGWLFSVYVFNIQLRNSDIVSYLFTGLGKMAHKMPGNGYERIWQLAGALGIITLLSLLFRSLLVHTQRKTKESRNDTDVNDLFIRISTEGIRYTSQTRARGWSLFWLRLGPKLFAIGVLIIFLSFYEGYDKSYDDLNVSLFGLLIGTAFATGIGGLVYLYLIKIIEPRNSSGKKYWFSGHIELLLAFVVLLVSLCALFFLRSGLEANSFYTFISIALFISGALIAGFLMGFGLLYESLFKRREELEDEIYEYNGYIFRYGGPQKAYLPKEFHTGVSKIVQELLQKIEQRGNTLFRRRFFFRRAKKNNIDDEIKEPKKNAFLEWVDRNWEKVLRFFEWLIMPAEHKPTDRSEQGFKDWSPEEWDADYFPDLSSSMKAYEEDIKKNEAAIDKITRELSSLSDGRFNPQARINWSLQQWNNRISNWQSEINKAELSRQKGKSALMHKYDIARRQVQEAHQLAIWYLSNGLDNDGPSPNKMQS